MKEELDAIRDDTVSRVASAASADAVRALRSEIIGKKGSMAAINQRLGALSPDERRDAGRLVNEARAAIEAVIEGRLAQLDDAERAAQLDAERLDLTEFTDEPRRGHLHVVTAATYRLEDVFVGMGYAVAEGPEVDTDWYSFGALNIPPSHPARSGFDTLYLRMNEPESVLFRPHTSPVQIRTMEAQEPPIYVICPGRVYRKDTPDARHTPAFSQIEGLVVDRGITFADLAGTIEEFTGAYFGPNIHSRLRPAYFPFTEPSAEFEITCVICEGKGWLVSPPLAELAPARSPLRCRTCSGTGWIELGGCGVVHPAVLRAGGIDPEEWSGFAFGFGIDRLAQMFHGISDMRVLLDNDIRFAGQF
jgi:phenylalanyl-tRNA synthetase alpha chain